MPGERRRRMPPPPPSGPVRVWSEVGVTICVTNDPPQFVKFTTGFERMAVDDDPESIAAVEQAIFDQCQEVVERRVAELTRVVESSQARPKEPHPGAHLLRRS